MGLVLGLVVRVWFWVSITNCFLHTLQFM